MPHSEERACCHCGDAKKEMRPYGPGGAWVCFSCAMATPERKSEAEAHLSAQLCAAERCGGVVVIGEPSGPRPLKGGADA